MSEYYRTMRDCYIKRVKSRYFLYTLFTYLASFVCFTIVFQTLTGPVNSEGKMLDLYGTGLACFMSFVFVVHALFFQNIRDWNKALRRFVILILFFFILVFLLMGMSNASSIFSRYLYEVLSSALFWLTIPVTVFLMVLPYTLERLWRQLLRHPQFYKQ